VRRYNIKRHVDTEVGYFLRSQAVITYAVNVVISRDVVTTEE